MAKSIKKKYEISIPGEWAFKKLLGPSLSELGTDFKQLYAWGRDKIIEVAFRKTDDIEDGKYPSLRVARDVFWNGAFTNDEICAEYFGGILASSRTPDGNDDSAIHYVDVIKSLSSKQLRLHYVVYNALNKMLTQKNSSINVANRAEIEAISIYMSTLEMVNSHGLKIETDLTVLYRQGLIAEYKYASETEGNFILPYVMIKPNTFGVMLYAAAHNKMDQWLNFPKLDFEDFEGIEPLKNYVDNLTALKKLDEITIDLGTEQTI